MSRFAETLRQTSERLTIPQPARSRVMLEIAADMDDLYDLYRERGIEDTEAVRRTIEEIDLSDSSLRELSALHSGPVRRLLGRLSDNVISRWEFGLLALLVVFFLLICQRLTDNRRVVADAGLFAWPVMALGIGIAILCLYKFYQLYLKEDHDFRQAGRGLGVLFGSVVALPLLCFTGSWFEAVRLSVGNAGDAHPVAAAVLGWTIQTTALLQIGLSIAVLGALAWFILAGKVGCIEKDEAAILFDSRIASTEGSGPGPLSEGR